MQRKVINAVLILVLVSGLTAGTWALRNWYRNRLAPDVRKVATTQAVNFMASADFNRLTESRRKQYVMDLIEQMGRKTFAELLGMMISGDDQQKQAAKNVQQLSRADRDEIGSRFMQMFLTKFYEQDAKHRADCLSMMVMAGASGRGAARAKEYNLPSPDNLKNDLAKFVTNQPPHAQAQLSQFMLDLSKQQEALGVGPKW